MSNMTVNRCMLLNFNEIFNNCPKIQDGDSNQRRENGKAIHVFALPKFKEQGYSVEYPIEYSFKENRQPNNEITLRGRIDAINFDKQEIIDIKTTTKPIEKVDKNPYILQVGTYTKIIELQTQKQFSAHILLINTTQHIISLTREQIESAYKEMIIRAIFASRLSKDKKQDISGLSQSKWNRENRLRKLRQWKNKYAEKYKEYILKWRTKHPNYWHEWYTKHREQILDHTRAYHAKHREQINARRREQRAKHREQYNAYMRAYHAKHREQINARKRKLRARKKAQQNSSSTLDKYT